MKSFDAKKLLSVIFICIIVFFMGSIGVKLVMSKVLHIYPEETNAAEAQPGETQAPSINWAETYPFSGDYGFKFQVSENVIETSPVKTTVLNKYEDSIRSVESNVDYYTSNLLFGRMKFVEMNASFNKLVGMNIVSGTDSVVVMRNGYLTFESTAVDMNYPTESTAYFYEYLNQKGIDFLYVQCPSKEDPQNNQLPYGVEDHYNKNADNFISSLSEKDVPYLDLRKNLSEDFDNHYSCFFKTDHHWTPETGVWASGKIAKELNLRYNYGMNDGIGKLSNYNVEVFEKYCFGSQGKKATLKYADPEDISFIYPKDKTDFTVVYDNGEALNGRFEDTLLRKDVFDKIDYYNVSTYSAYFHGSHSLSTVHNNKVSNGKRMVYIMDSFSASVVPYIANEVEDMLVLDLRNFNGSVTKAIEDFNPDTVVVAYNPSTFSSDTSHSGTFNFE